MQWKRIYLSLVFAEVSKYINVSYGREYIPAYHQDYIPEVNPPLFHDFPIHKDEVNGKYDTTHDIKIATKKSDLSEITRESCNSCQIQAHHQAVKTDW